MTATRAPRSLLVTGAAGFIGSAFVRWLYGVAGYRGRVVVLDALTYAGNRQNLATVSGRPDYHFVHGDIGDGRTVADLCRVHGVDAVINFAAETHVDRSIHSPSTFIATNVQGTLTLLDVCRELGGIHFHQVSTDEVYGSLGPQGRFTETSPIAPRSPYSASKAAADHLVRAYQATFGLSVTLSVCSNNYGPYQFPEKLIPLMILRCLEGKPLPVYGDGKNVRDWLFVDDHAAAVWAIVCRGRAAETYNVGGDCELENLTLLHQLVEVVAEEAGRDVESLRRQITFVADRPGHDRRYAIDCSRIRGELGWKPAVDFAGGLRRTVRWYLDHPEWVAAVQSGAYREWIDKNYGARPARAPASTPVKEPVA